MTVEVLPPLAQLFVEEYNACSPTSKAALAAEMLATIIKAHARSFKAGESPKALLIAIDALMGNYDVLGKRIVARRILEHLKDWADKPVIAPGTPAPCTDKEAERVGVANVMQFGQHRGLPWEEVPLEYLQWLCDEKRKEWVALWRYVNSPYKLKESD